MSGDGDLSSATAPGRELHRFAPAEPCILKDRDGRQELVVTVDLPPGGGLTRSARRRVVEPSESGVGHEEFQERPVIPAEIDRDPRAPLPENQATFPGEKAAQEFLQPRLECAGCEQPSGRVYITSRLGEMVCSA
jgi:hypothetical protein